MTSENAPKIGFGAQKNAFLLMVSKKTLCK